MPDQSLAVISTVQGAVTSMLLTVLPDFIRIGRGVFGAAVVPLFAWHGLSWMFGTGDPAGKAYELARTIMQASFCLFMLTFYATPIPGLGRAFPNIITDSTAYLTQLLDVRSVEAAFRSLDELWSRFSFTDLFSVTSNVLYWGLWFVVTLVKCASVAVVAFSFVASAVCVLLGPLFIPFLIVPQFDWMFWGWIKSLTQYSFIPVVAMSWMFVAQHVISTLVTTLPAAIDISTVGFYGIEVMVVLGTVLTGIVSAPLLTSSIFSGHSHSGGGMGVVSTLIRLGR